ncbi:MAG: ribosome small subunit-dependent GTPase A [Treponema sp.]|jgi:ribosome biogenesis GTPase|nr:ribosome small subunit-dependent GTPase A [Treponema sp.]
MRGLVIRGSRNIFTLRFASGGEEREEECRIKGKILKEARGYYNPLAPGDVVRVEEGLIVSLEKRKNAFSRFNQKGQAPQLLAANVDLVLCVSSPVSPPFRPRFLDRCLLEADIAGIPAALVVNKWDLISSSPDRLDTEERLEDFKRIGYPVFRLSALTGFGMEEFRRFIGGKFSVLVGQSGVGKSSLVKAMAPDLDIRTEPVNEKYDRGNHTTTLSALLEIPGSGRGPKTRLVDTPGIRRFLPEQIPPEDLIYHMREFAPLAGRCTYGLSCSHAGEPGCKIMEAVDAGVIHEERYANFLKIRDELSGASVYPDND